ncbi:hypothetical protein [Nocardia niigatensis]
MNNQNQRIIPARVRAEHPAIFAQVEAGTLHAEALSPSDRRLMMRYLVADGHTDRQIAARTGWTLYTTTRIREALKLPANVRLESECA